MTEKLVEFITYAGFATSDTPWSEACRQLGKGEAVTQHIANASPEVFAAMAEALNATIAIKISRSDESGSLDEHGRLVDAEAAAYDKLESLFKQEQHHE